MKLWKVQKFFGDVVYDLRNRGLLPVVVLLAIGMIVVPVMISRGGSSAPAPSAPASSEQAADLAPENQRAVVAYSPPALRNYKKRLNELAAKDPFRQQFVQQATAASQLESTGGGSGDTGSTGSGTLTPTQPGTGGGGGGGGETEGTPTPSSSRKGGLRYFYFDADLLVGEAGTTLQRRNNVPRVTTLPNPGLPVLVYLGATLDGKHALFVLSSKVSQVSGPGICAPSPEECSILSLDAGETETLLYDGDAKTYQVKVLKLKRVVTRKPPGG